MAARVICLSRAMWAGADEVAAEVGRELGFRCIDEAIISRVAERERLDPEHVASVEQRKSFLARLFEDSSMGAGMAAYGTGFMPDPGVLPPGAERLRELIRQAVVETAQQGEVVIVAHAASYALGAREGVLRVLVTGSQGVRAGRLAQQQGMGADAAADAIRKSDAARADYLKRFYRVEREMPEHYDLAFSTDTLSPQKVASAIVQFARA